MALANQAKLTPTKQDSMLEGDDDDEDDEDDDDSGSVDLAGAFLDMLIGYNSKGKNGKIINRNDTNEIINEIEM
jgi:hypothetical protein